MRWSLVAASIAVVSAPLALAAPVTFSVTLDPAARAEPASGRLVVFLIKDGARLRPGQEPADGPFWDDPQPLFGVDVKDLKPGSPATLDDGATFFPERPSALPPGTYRAQAALIVNRTTSSWRSEGGNFTSDVVSFTLAPERAEPLAVALTLKNPTEPAAGETVAGVEYVEVRSELLSAFRGRDVVLRAGVVKPKNFDEARTYPAVYEVPGFGGRHFDAARVQGRLHAAPPGSPAALLAANVFWIVLDPESPNGHTLFADSANNGPWGAALTTELIPALEQRFKLVARPEGRLLRGHSSGGWSTLWLALTYPDVFGGAWSTAPDPVDFRRFQRTNIYDEPNMFVGPDGLDVSSFRRAQGNLMTVREENGGEEVLGPDNTSGQQWDSWMAVFGPKNAAGNPAALFDPRTGLMDKTIAEQFRRFDLGHLLRTEPAKYAPLFRGRVRLLVGDQDSFYLNEAVELLRKDLDAVPAEQRGPDGPGYVRVLPGYDHGSIFAAPEVREFPGQMLQSLKDAGLYDGSIPTTPDPGPRPAAPAKAPPRKE